MPRDVQRPRPTRRRGDDGAAVADFAMVGGLVALVFAALLQLGTVLLVRNTLIDCVGEGARFGALADRTPADGAERARTLITESLSARYAGDVTARRLSGDGGAPEQVEVVVRAPVPLAGLLGSTAVTAVVRGHGAVQTLPGPGS